MFQAPLALRPVETDFQFDDAFGLRAQEEKTAQQSLAKTAPAWLLNALPGYTASQARAREAWYFALDESRDRLGFELGGSMGLFSSSGYGVFNTNSLGNFALADGFAGSKSSGSTAYGLSTSDNGGIIRAPDEISAARTWGNTGTDFNAGASWTTAVAPGSGDVALFSTPAVTQPNVTASTTIAGLYFAAGATGYDLTSSSTATILTLNGTNGTGSGGTSTASAAAIRNDNVSGTTIIDAPLSLASSTGISTFFQEAADGSTLILNGVISETGGPKLLSLKNGTFQLNNANTYTGGTSIDAAGTVVVVGNDSALGTGSFTFASSGTVEAGGGSRTIANNVFFTSGTPTIGGSNNITFTGNLTNSGAANRTITVNNSGNTTVSGNLYLAGDNVTARAVTINGTGAITISGVIANNNAGNTVASSLIKSGANTLTLTGTNTYTGTTTVSGGTLLVNGNQTAATGAVSVSNAGTVLGGTGTIGGATAINSNGTITGATNGSTGTLTLNNNLMFTGTAGNLATYLVDLTSLTSDTLAIAGTLNLTSLFDQISFQGTAGAAIYTLATYSSLTGPLDTFNSVVNLPEGYTLVYGPTELDLVFTAIPEPNTWIGGAFALAAIGFTQRKRFAKRARVIG
jgi:autotransporter-associated beta strand protein